MNEYKIEMIIIMIRNEEWKENEEMLNEKLRVKWRIKIVFEIEKKERKKERRNIMKIKKYKIKMK